MKVELHRRVEVRHFGETIPVALSFPNAQESQIVGLLAHIKTREVGIVEQSSEHVVSLASHIVWVKRVVRQSFLHSRQIFNFVSATNRRFKLFVLKVLHLKLSLRFKIL